MRLLFGFSALSCLAAAFTPFWIPGGPPTAEISHVKVPSHISKNYTLYAGLLGINKYADPTFTAQMDALAAKSGCGGGLGRATSGTVTPDGQCSKETGGWARETGALYDDFTDGLTSKHFAIDVGRHLHGHTDNVELVRDTVFGKSKPVLRLKAVSAPAANGNNAVQSSGNIQSFGLYSSARYEVVAKFPPALGLVLAVWTFHYEEHENASDPQTVPGVSGSKPPTITNHEIDIEIPASCPGLCPKPAFCQGQFDTMNINNYIYTNDDGTGPAYSNLCVKKESGGGFVDDQYHSYRFDWHSGGGNETARVDFFFDDEYIGTNDVFAPTRASRLVIALWPGNKNWVNVPDWIGERYAYVSSVAITPFNEPNDATYPQNYDQPFDHKTWVTKDIPPLNFKV